MAAVSSVWIHKPSISEFKLLLILIHSVRLIITRNIIKNNTIRNNKDDGIYTYDSVFNVIENNHFNRNGGEAINMGYSDSDYLIKDNILFEDYIEIPLNSFNNIVINNTVDGKEILYFENEYNINICEDIFGQIILNNCEKISLENQKARISLLSSNNCSIFNNSISNVNIGIHLYCSDYNVINNCYLTDIKYNGILIEKSNNNIISNNTVNNGIKLFDSQSNKIDYNSITYMFIGYESHSNTITDNTILNMEIDMSNSNILKGNTVEGIFNLSFAVSNIISNNNFRNCHFNSIISQLNIISKNNFYNVIVVFIQYIFRFFLINIWRENYWGKPGYLPEPIFGLLTFGLRGDLSLFKIPWVCFDWHPAKEPYDIEV